MGRVKSRCEFGSISVQVQIKRIAVGPFLNHVPSSGQRHSDHNQTDDQENAGRKPAQTSKIVGCLAHMAATASSVTGRSPIAESVDFQMFGILVELTSSRRIKCDQKPDDVAGKFSRIQIVENR